MSLTAAGPVMTSLLVKLLRLFRLIVSYRVQICYYNLHNVRTGAARSRPGKARDAGG